MKKLLCLLAVITVCGVTASAAGGISVDPGAEFESYEAGGDASAVTDIVGMTDAELADYCKNNNIVYFAVNGDNTKQIRVTVSETAFSAGIGNLSVLPDEKITALIPEFTGSDEISGTIAEKDGQKFVRINVETDDSGGKYSVLQYITVAEKKEYTLSFYTSDGQSMDYTDKAFESFNAEAFTSPSDNADASPLKYAVIAAMAAFAAVCAVVIFTLIRDIKKRTD